MVKSDPIDNSDKDYQPILYMPPHTHDREAGGSSSVPPQPPQIDPTLLALLERMRQDQAHQTQEIAAAIAQMQAR
jgi:hypothetical protein